MAKIVTWIIVLAVLIVGGLAIFGGKDANSSVIKIGFIGPLTGDAVAYGESESRAIQIAIQELNAAGGIDGKQFELISEDAKCDPQIGGTAAQKLVNIDGVKVIIGGACSGETLAAAEVTESARVILISPSASSPKITNAGDFLFRTYPSDALAGKIAAKYALETLGVKKVALITELTDYGQALREVFKEAITNGGGEVVADETYASGDADFRTQILKVKESKPDVVYIVPQTPTPGLALLKQGKENGIKVPFMTGEVLLDRQVVKENAALLEGLIGVETGVDWEGNPKAKAFAEAHQAKFGTEPGTFAANAYDAVYLIADAIRAHGLDTEKIRDWLYAVENWQGTVGAITMDENGDPLLGENIRKIVKGEVTDLGVVTP